MYSTLPAFILGFHGTDRRIAEEVFSGKINLNKSSNDYDWLGPGIYFWENNHLRALSFAREMKGRKKYGEAIVSEEAVVGAIINPGRCLDLLNEQSILMVKEAYKTLKAYADEANVPLPENKPLKSSRDLIFRNLDKAVIQTLHELIKEKNEKPFDTIRAAFWEGDVIYPESGFREKNHIQICVCNPNCIWGYFRPREIDPTFPCAGR
ncbi:MAG TPA: hypothetical protein PKO25_05685 [Spirochaetota bacterium]|nr:hypothetical protein [Spirochaetota bacterium]HNU91344.1 hypothetical protein [Spirochaetota bacterium]HPV97803.1 hypothetical protein [Spirochaetota bacterium]